jgi:hypothetical protein
MPFPIALGEAQHCSAVAFHECRSPVKGRLLRLVREFMHKPLQLTTKSFRTVVDQLGEMSLDLSEGRPQRACAFFKKSQRFLFLGDLFAKVSDFQLAERDVRFCRTDA